jgi:hypothetical protein
MKRLSDEWLDRAEAGYYHVTNKLIAPILRKIPEDQRDRADEIAWLYMNNGKDKIEAFKIAVDELIEHNYEETPTERYLRHRYGQ